MPWGFASPFLSWIRDKMNFIMTSLRFSFSVVFYPLTLLLQVKYFPKMKCHLALDYFFDFM